MIPSLHRFRQSALAAGATALTLTLTGCVSMDPALLSGLPGDLLSGAGTLRNIRNNPGDLNNIHRVIGLIATVHRYAALTASQRRHVEVVVTRRYEGMVEKEKKSLRPHYESKKTAVRKRAAAKSSGVARQNPGTAAKIDADTEKEIRQVDLEWEKAAKSSVAKNYGTDFAVPVASDDGKAVVAFASVKESGVSISNDSYIADNSGQLAKGSQVSHAGKTYAVIQ